MATRSEAETVLNAFSDAAEEGSTALYTDEQQELAEWLGVPWALIALGLDGVGAAAIDEFVAWWPGRAGAGGQTGGQ